MADERANCRPAAIPPEEEIRLKVLQRYNVLDTPPEEAFDALTRIATTIFNVPISLVSLVDRTRQWFKSKQGLDVNETSRDASFCAYAILDDRVLIVPDTLSDERFQNNSIVLAEPRIRFYAGAPLVSPEGHRLGALCIIDTKPREMTNEQIELLKCLRDAAMVHLELRRAAAQRERALLASRETIERHESALLALVTRIGRDSRGFRDDLKAITEAASRTLDVGRVGIWLHSEDRSEIKCIDLYEQEKNLHSEGMVLAAKDFPDYFEAVERGRYIAADDARGHPVTKAFGESYLIPLGITSMLDATIRIGGRTVGIVCHEHVGESRTWTPEETLFSGSVADLVALALDARDREEIEERRKALEAQYLQAQKMEAVGRLTGGIAHDFNNLLMPILGYSQMLSAKKKPDDGDLKYLSEIEKAGRRASVLIRQLMAFSRSQVLAPKIVDLNRLIADFQKMLQRVIGEDIRLETSFTNEPALVRIDPGQMEQVIMNLTVNARDAMPQGGHLRFRTEFKEISGEEDGLAAGRYVVMAVEDSGEGIPPDVLPKIFDPFFTTKEKGKGTGLGLATCHGIIHQSGGSVRAESRVGRGTTLLIHLPRSNGKESDEIRDEQARLRGGTESVLIVEDDSAIRFLLKEILSVNGYRAIVSEDGPRALERIQDPNVTIDLLITDFVMPGMSGTRLIDLALKHRPSLKSLVITGYPDREISEMGAVRGPALLQKPFGPSELLRTVRAILDGERR